MASPRPDPTQPVVPLIPAPSSRMVNMLEARIQGLQTLEGQAVHQEIHTLAVVALQAEGAPQGQGLLHPLGQIQPPPGGHRQRAR